MIGLHACCNFFPPAGKHELTGRARSKGGDVSTPTLATSKALTFAPTLTFAFTPDPLSSYTDEKVLKAIKLALKWFV